MFLFTNFHPSSAFKFARFSSFETDALLNFAKMQPLPVNLTSCVFRKRLLRFCSVVVY